MRCFSAKKNVEKNVKICCKHDVLEPSKQALLALRDVIISSQNFGSKWQRFFTLGDGCWLPNKRPKHPTHDGFLLVFPRNVIRIRVDARNSSMHPVKKFPID